MSGFQTTDADFESYLNTGLVRLIDWKVSQGPKMNMEKMTVEEIPGVFVRWRISDTLSHEARLDLQGYIAARYMSDDVPMGANYSAVLNEMQLFIPEPEAESFRTEMLEKAKGSRGR